MHILEIFLLVNLDFHKLAAMNTVVVSTYRLHRPFAIRVVFAGNFNGP